MGRPASRLGVPVDRQDPATGVDRCAEYAEAFDDTWTSTPAPTRIRAVRPPLQQSWDVGIYCADRGDFLVQVRSLEATSP